MNKFTKEDKILLSKFLYPTDECRKFVLNDLNQELNNLIDNLKVKGCFTNMGITLGVSVLSYLGIKDEKLVDTYLKLVDYETKEEETEFKIIY